MKQFVSVKALKSVSWVDALVLSSVAIAAFLFWQPSTPWLRQGTIYVSPSGANWQLGHSPKTAVKTIQRAANLAAPGEEVIILPGTYHETLRIRRGGLPGQPITLRAQQPGTVTITQAVEKMETDFQWQPEGGNIFSTPVPWPIHYLLYQGITVFQVPRGGLPYLQELTARPGAWPALHFSYEQQRLYLFMPAGKPPNQGDLLIHRPIPIPFAWGQVRTANVWVEANYVVFDGLQFELGVDAGLLLWDAQHVTVRNCVFTGSTFGIAAQPQLQPANHLMVENNLYHNFPQYYWQRDWLTWQEVYANHRYTRSTLLFFRDSDVVVRHNLTAHTGDALQISPTIESEHLIGAKVYGNLLMYGTDDAIEFDGSAQKVHFHNNLIYESFQNLGLSPVLDGPVLIENNLFLHPADGINGSQLKLLNPWHRPEQVKYSVIRNIQVRNNTFVGNWLAWWGQPPVEDVTVQNNVFAIRYRKDPPWPPGVTAINNTMIQLPEGSYPNPGTDPQWWIEWSMPRPGPPWLDYTDYPATHDIPKVLYPLLVK